MYFSKKSIKPNRMREDFGLSKISEMVSSSSIRYSLNEIEMFSFFEWSLFSVVVSEFMMELVLVEDSILPMNCAVEMLIMSDVDENFPILIKLLIFD